MTDDFLPRFLFSQQEAREKVANRNVIIIYILAEQAQSWEKTQSRTLFFLQMTNTVGIFTPETSDGLETPAIDRLKRMGVALPNTISNCPVCMPTRFTWLTGLYASQSPSGPRNAKDWPYGYKTVAHALRRSGYQTAIIGKLHSHCGATVAKHHMNELEKHTYERGFDYVYECNGTGGNKKSEGGVFASSRYTDYIKDKYGEDFLVKMAEDRASRDHRVGGKYVFSFIRSRRRPD